jgi:hypothetical protein
MTSIFWFARVRGGGMILLSLLGDVFGADVGDVADLGDPGSADATGSAGDVVAASSWLSIFSLRSLTYLLFGFGLAGVVLAYIWDGARPAVTLIAAVLAGILAARLNALLMGYIRRTESGAMAGDAALTGLPARVTLPLADGGTGKVEVERSGRTHELLARPHGTPASDPAGWGEVVVVEMEDGVALVVPLEDRK